MGEKAGKGIEPLDARCTFCTKRDPTTLLRAIEKLGLDFVAEGCPRPQGAMGRRLVEATEVGSRPENYGKIFDIMLLPCRKPQ